MREPIKIMLMMSESKARRLFQFFAGDHWNVCRYEDLREATRVLEADRSLRVVIVASAVRGGCWRDALRVVRRSNRACQIILAVERASVSFWCDALEEGVYDLLVEPLCAEQICSIAEAAAAWSVIQSLDDMDQFESRDDESQ
jgi:DNA-binding NtrC family response regulator